jgi:hypothetical protein
VNKLIVALALTAAAFAASTAHLARELRIEQQRARIVTNPTAQTAPHSDTIETHAVAVAPTDVSGTPPAAPGATPPSSADTPPAAAPSHYPQNKAEDLALKQDVLRRLTDPAGRGELLAESKTRLRSDFIGLAKKIGLTPDEEDALLTLLSEQQLESSEKRLRCELDPACDHEPRAMLALVDSNTSQAAQVALLGQARFDRFVAYQDSLTERRQVAALRTSLSESDSISETQAERLIDALAAERHRFHDEATQQGNSVAGLITSLGIVYNTTGPTTPDERASRIESALEYNRRLHAKAAEVLTARQLEVFDRMQAQVVWILRENLRQEEALSAARRTQTP